MSNEFLLMVHPSLGVLGVLAATWVFVDTLNVRPETLGRIRFASYASAALIWGSYLIGGYWYLAYYGSDRALIKAGPWPFAHDFFMETKEHVFLSLLLLATFLPIAASGDLMASRGARNLVLWSALFVVGLGLAMEGAGAVIGMGAKVAALAQSSQYAETIMTSIDQAPSASSRSTRIALGTYAVAFGISLGLTSLFNALVVVVKETNQETVLAWMTAATGHHWVTQGVIDLIVFVALGLVLARYSESWRSRPNAVIAVAFGGIVLGALVIAGFFG